MSAPVELNLIRFARLLTAQFDANGENANLVAGGSSNFKRCFSQSHAPGAQGQQAMFSSLALNYNWHRDITQSPSHVEHDEYIKLLSREISFGRQNVSFAPTTLLRNVVLSFGKILEFQLQRTIFLVMEAYKTKSMDKNVNISQEDRDRIFQAFKQLSSPHISVAKPIAASIKFSSMIPDSEIRQNEFGEQEFLTHFRFEVDMIVLLPKDLTIPISLKASSRFLAKCSNGSLPDSIDVAIDTDELYQNMRRQSKIISKKVITDAVGYDIFAKSKRRTVIPSQGRNDSSVSPSTDGSTVYTCETISFSNAGTKQVTKGYQHEHNQDSASCESEEREPVSHNSVNDDDKYKREASVMKKRHIGLRHFFSRKTSSSESF